MSNLEKAGRLLRLMGWIGLVGIGIIGAVAIPGLLSDSESGTSVGFIVIFLILLLIPILHLKAGTAIKEGKKWGKVTGVVIAFLSLANLPIGTIFGIATLFYLNKGWNEGAEST